MLVIRHSTFSGHAMATVMALAFLSVTAVADAAPAFSMSTHPFTKLCARRTPLLLRYSSTITSPGRTRTASFKRNPICWNTFAQLNFVT